MTPKWFEITTNSIIKRMCFLFNIKPDTFEWIEIDQSPAPSPPPPPHTHTHTHTNPSLHSIDDETKAPATFRWHLIFT